MASTAYKEQDGVKETTEPNVSPALTKAMATNTPNISDVTEAKFDFFLQKNRDISKELQDTNMLMKLYFSYG